MAIQKSLNSVWQDFVQQFKLMNIDQDEVRSQEFKQGPHAVVSGLMYNGLNCVGKRIRDESMGMDYSYEGQYSTQID